MLPPQYLHHDQKNSYRCLLTLRATLIEPFGVAVRTLHSTVICPGLLNVSCEGLTVSVRCRHVYALCDIGHSVPETSSETVRGGSNILQK